MRERRTVPRPNSFERGVHGSIGGPAMKGILLWLIGIPIPIIILLYLFNVL
jgi:hypothetical protein